MIVMGNVRSGSHQRLHKFQAAGLNGLIQRDIMVSIFGIRQRWIIGQQTGHGLKIMIIDRLQQQDSPVTAAPPARTGLSSHLPGVPHSDEALPETANRIDRPLPHQYR